MIGNYKKQEDLEQLKKFIQKEKIEGFVSHFWYYTLRTRYPFMFLQLMKKYRNTTKGPKAVEYDDELIRDAKNRVQELITRLNNYILEPPDDKEKIKDFEHRITGLEDLLLKQNLEN